MYDYFENIVEEKIRPESKLRKIDERRNYFLEKIQQNELMSRNNNKVSTALNYIQHFFGLASAITGCISFYGFPSLLGIPIGITGSDIGLKICAIAAGFKKYKSTNKRNRKKHDKIV